MGNIIAYFSNDTENVEQNYTSMDDYSKEQIVEYIKNMSPHSLEIQGQYLEVFKTINMDSSNLIVMCIELYEKLAKSIPQYTPPKPKTKSYKKSKYVKPEFTGQQYRDYVISTTPQLVPVDLDMGEPTKPTTMLNCKGVGIVEFVESFRETNYKMDPIGMNRRILSEMTDFQKTRFINAFNRMFVNGDSTSRVAFGKGSYIYKRGDADKVESFRVVLTIPIIMNHFHRILSIRLSDYLLKNNYIDINIQKGGINGNKMPLLQQIYKVKSVIKEANKSNKKLAMMFLDVSNAYGNLSLPVLYQIMRKYHIEDQFITYVKNYYDNFQYYIKTKEWSTDLIKWSNGLVTGCPLSPVLFILALNYVLVHIDGKMKTTHGYNIKSTGHVLFTAFMDDVCIMTRNINSLQEVYTRVKNLFGLLNLPVNQKKTQIMLINEDRVDGVLSEFEYVTHYKYLGQEISNDGKSTLSYKTFLSTLGRQLHVLDASTTKSNTEKIETFNSYILPYIHRQTAAMYDLSNAQRKFVASLVKKYTTGWNYTGDIQLFSTNINTVLESEDEVVKMLDHEEYDNIEDDIELLNLKYEQTDFNNYTYENVKQDVAMEEQLAVTVPVVENIQIE